MDETRERAHRAWMRAEKIRSLSDGLIRLGPVNLGIDAALAWVPVAGTVYSAGAAGLLIAEALAAGASRRTLRRMAVHLGIDTLSSGVPVLGWAVDTLFPGHAMAARALQKDIEARHGRPAAAPPEPRRRLGGRRRAPA